jgi:hypothetical protein
VQFLFERVEKLTDTKPRGAFTPRLTPALVRAPMVNGDQSKEQWQRLEPDERCDVLDEGEAFGLTGARPAIATYSPLLPRLG